MVKEELINYEEQFREEKQKFNDIFSQVIWPQNVKKINKDYYKSISPKRSVNDDGVGETGFFYSEKMDRKVQYESHLELEFLHILENFKEVTWFVEQPFYIKYRFNNRTHKYFPDFFVIINEYYPVILEIKPKTKMVLKRNILKFKALKKYCNKNGYGYLIIDKYKSLNKILKNDHNVEFENEILSKLNKQTKIYWDDFKKIRNKYAAKINDFISIVVKHNLEWTLYPFIIQKADYSFSDNLLVQTNKKFFNQIKYDVSNIDMNKEVDNSKRKRINIDINSSDRNKKPDRHGEKWSLEEENQLIKEYEQGYRIQQIANIHKRSFKAIKTRLYKHFDKQDVKKRIKEET